MGRDDLVKMFFGMSATEMETWMQDAGLNLFGMNKTGIDFHVAFQDILEKAVKANDIGMMTDYQSLVFWDLLSEMSDDSEVVGKAFTDKYGKEMSGISSLNQTVWALTSNDAAISEATLSELYTYLFALKNHYGPDGRKSGYSELFAKDEADATKKIRELIGLIQYGDPKAAEELGIDMNADEFLQNYGHLIDPNKTKFTQRDYDNLQGNYLNTVTKVQISDAKKEVAYPNASEMILSALELWLSAKSGWAGTADEEERRKYDEQALSAISTLVSTGLYSFEDLVNNWDPNRIIEEIRSFYALNEEEINQIILHDSSEAIQAIEQKFVESVDGYVKMQSTAVESLTTIQKQFSESSVLAAKDFAGNIGIILTDLAQRKQALDAMMETYGWIKVESSGSNYVPQANARGTRDARAGLSWVNEMGIEMLATSQGQLIELNPHEKIFNNDQLNYLYDLSKQKANKISQAVSMITSNDNSLVIDNLNISLDNVTDGQSFMEELRGLTGYIRNTKTIYGNSR
jgi:hypothetical protein